MSVPGTFVMFPKDFLAAFPEVQPKKAAMCDIVALLFTLVSGSKVAAEALAAVFHIRL